MKQLVVAALAACVVAAPRDPAVAQEAPSLGTAAGLGGTAVTQARRADAVLWNPALVGIYDGPVRSSSLLGIDAAHLPGSRGVEASARLGLLSGRVEDDRFGSVSGTLPWGGSRVEAASQVRWVAVQARDFAFSVDTRFGARATLPENLAEELAQDAEVETGTVGHSERSLVSTLAASRGHFLGDLPGLGRAWVGATVKGYLVHEAARGQITDLPGPAVLTETRLRNAGGAGLDIGLAGLVGPRLWYGVSATNVFQMTFQPSEGPRQRFVRAETSAEGGTQFEQSWGPEIRPDDPDGAALEQAEALWDRTRFPSVLRGGLSYATSGGTFSAAVRETLTEGSLDPAGRESPRTVAWASRTGALRLSYGWGEGREAISAATSWGRCDRRWTAGLRSAQGGAFGVFVDLSLGNWECNAQLPDAR